MDSPIRKEEKYRPLTSSEIAHLEANGCVADNWENVMVADTFTATHIARVRFSGRIRLGAFHATHTLEGGLPRHSGIEDATLHDTTIGDDCLIMHIGQHISHYDIGAHSIIAHTSVLVVTAPTCFGEGTTINVLSETGGREVVIYSELSAQEAYMQAMYRHQPDLVEALKTRALAHARQCSSQRGTIGMGCTLVGCGRICNVRIGPYARLEGVTCLEGGTINSSASAPTHIGHGTIADDFIISKGCHIGEGSLLSRCFVGEASHIGRGFSATDCYFASNCQAEHGEACAVFAGPFTVTHHKSTLLIGGMFSFMNAGSGTNQSNHAYKLGPMHHGILGRGSKTASGTHIIWPARVGDFSMVMGKLTTHPDSHEFPFSYLLAEERLVWLIPGIALRNIGTRRDIEKWPMRDGRKQDGTMLDRITFAAFTPLTAGAMLHARALLTQLDRSATDGKGHLIYKGMCIKHQHIHTGIQLYDDAVNVYLGDRLMERLEQWKDQHLQQLLMPKEEYPATWCDLGGMVAPHEEVEKAIAGYLHTADDTYLPDMLDKMYTNYKEYEWAWVYQNAGLHNNTGTPHALAVRCAEILGRRNESAARLHQAILADARKEFSPEYGVGFGIDGDEHTATADFQQVRGRMEENSFIRSIEDTFCRQQETTAIMTKRLLDLKD